MNAAASTATTLVKISSLITNGQILLAVGAGSTGCRLADKLSAVQDVNVLLLEAGKEPPEFTEIPLMAKLGFGSDAVQRYRVEPMKNAFITNPNQVDI